MDGAAGSGRPWACGRACLVQPPGLRRAVVLPSAAAGRAAAFGHLKAHLRAGPAPAPRRSAPVGPRSAIRTSAPPDRVSDPCPGGAGSGRPGRHHGPGRALVAGHGVLLALQPPPTPPRRSSPRLRRRGTGTERRVPGRRRSPRRPRRPRAHLLGGRPALLPQRHRHRRRHRRPAAGVGAPIRPQVRPRSAPRSARPPRGAPRGEDRPAPRPHDLRPVALQGRTHRAGRALPRLPMARHRTRPRDARRSSTPARRRPSTPGPKPPPTPGCGSTPGGPNRPPPPPASSICTASDGPRTAKGPPWRGC